MLDLNGEEYSHEFVFNAKRPILNVGCYDRASSKPQMDNYARPGNRSCMEQYCKEQKWNVVAYGCDCCSGIFSEEKYRPIFYEMLRNDDLDTIFVYSSDRLARGVDVLFDLKEKANEYKKNLVLLRSPIELEFLNDMKKLFQLVRLINIDE